LNAEWAVEAKDLTMRFGKFTAVDKVTFSVGKGEIFGFLGANGAGKTTTIRMLCGLLEPTSGTARISGKEWHDGVDEIKRRVGYMSQRFTLYDDMTVEENLDFTSALRKLVPEEAVKRIGELAAMAGLTYPMNTLVRDLPPGVKQQISLVSAMLHDPEIVFLDEPTAGVTPVSRQRFWSLIRGLAGAGKTVFVTTHYMDEAEQCQRIALMRAGKIIALDSPGGLKETAFPMPLLEITLGHDAPADWRAQISKGGKVGELSPHGMRYHLAVKDPGAWDEVSRRLPAGLAVRRIPPSLEDVFMRLVEASER